MYIESERIKEIIAANQAHIVPASIIGEFYSYLDPLGWTLSGEIDWSRIGHLNVTLSNLSETWSPSRAVEQTFISHDSHMVFTFTPDQPGIICDMDFALLELDMVYWKAPGMRYMFGAELTEVIKPHFSNFCEYNGGDTLAISSSFTV